MFQTKGLKPKNSKSQAAMEFLMTYGWALLVILIVIAALVFFGLLNPEAFLPDKVEIDAGVSVQAASVDEDGITFIFQNNLGRPISNFQVNVSECNDQASLLSTPVSLSTGESKVVKIYCTKNEEAASKFKSDIKLFYTTYSVGTSLSHEKNGFMRVTVSEGETFSDTWCEGADINRDTIVSVSDYQSLKNYDGYSDTECLALATPPLRGNCTNSDIDGDGIRSQFYSDFEILREHFFSGDCGP